MMRRQAITHRELREVESPLEMSREDDLGVDTDRTQGRGKDCRGRGEALVRDAQARF